MQWRGGGCGGFGPIPQPRRASCTGPHAVAATTVQIVDLPSWMASHFRREDLVVVKMDVEGHEFTILQRMRQMGLLGLVDVLGIECHQPMHRRAPDRDCRRLIRDVKAAGVTVLAEPQYQPSDEWWEARVSRFESTVRSATCAPLYPPFNASA